MCCKEKWKCMKEYFHNINNNDIATNKHFWNFIRLFLVNKGSLNNSEIMLEKKRKLLLTPKK